MPAAFAHDLYGRLVYSLLDKETKRAIKRYKDCFYLGLHGPDPLFFYRALGKNELTEKGHRLHEQPAYGIFSFGCKTIEEAGNKADQDALTSYLLGFACHFALDHSLHGLINEITAQTDFTHGEVETELDRRLMVREGLEPLRTNTMTHIKNTPATRMASSRVLMEREERMSEAIASFHAVGRIFVNTGECFKTGLCMILRAAGCYQGIHGMIMRKRETPGLKTFTDRLEQKFRESVPFGAKLTQDLFLTLSEGSPLPDAFSGNFEGQKGWETK
ncbi:MAG: zinc dependent phospholipase C family protein [Lachnospiraceae bacterium]|nr:zinc dependent phospholipase C family protein [Lachnospiraceae bacterium]